MDNTNRGAIWINDDKAQGSKQPDMTGKINVEGKDYDIALWYYPPKENKKEFYSAMIKEPYIKPTENNNTAPHLRDKKEESNDDLPF